MQMLVNLIDNIRRFGLEYVFKRYYSFYRGQITNATDPNNQGRVRVRVPELFGETELPVWAQPRSLFAGPNFGAKFRVDEDDWVYVWFEKGDARAPVFDAGWWALDELPEDFQTPTNSGFVFKGGAKILVEEEEGKKRIRIVGANDAGELGSIFIIDDTTDAEAIFLIHTPTGSQIQLTNSGINFVASDGSLINLDTETGKILLTQKDGSLVSLEESQIVMSQAAGKTLITMKEDVLDIVSDSDVSVSAQNVGLNAGNVALGANASLSAMIAENMIELFDKHTHGTPAGPSGPPVPPDTAALTDANPATGLAAQFVKVKGNS